MLEGGGDEIEFLLLEEAFHGVEALLEFGVSGGHEEFRVGPAAACEVDRRE